MTRSSGAVTLLCCALTAVGLSYDHASAQVVARTAVGRYYRLELPVTASRYVDEVLIERVAPYNIAPPAPIAPVPLRVPLRGLTGQILELPERQLLYFAALDAAGSARLFEIDLIGRQARPVIPPADLGAPYALQFLAASDGSKLYVQWFAPGAMYETHIYDGVTLRWLGRTVEFQPDERAIGFENRPPYLWTLDRASRPVLVNLNRDRIEQVFDYTRVVGPVRGAVADAWRDLLLLRLDAGHDRFRLLDVVSGELGPALDLEEFRRAVPRLALDGRLLVLADRESAVLRRGRRQVAIATGEGEIFDLRLGRRVGEFDLAVTPDLPVDALGTDGDRSRPGRLWVYVPTDEQRFDFDLPACDRRTPAADRVEATLDAAWDPYDPLRYRYRVLVAAGSPSPAGAVAVRAGREAVNVFGPGGWGIDRIKGERWVRWTNGLGPPEEDIAPNTIGAGFEVEGRSDTRPGIAEYRVQAALELPRGCEDDDRFLKNSVPGYTIAPVRVTSVDPRKLARRLEGLLDRACEIGWLDPAACASLKPAATAVTAGAAGAAGADQAAALARFEEIRAGLTPQQPWVTALLADAAAAVRQASED